MNIGPFIFIGLLITFSASWFGYVFKPQAELSRQEPFADPISGAIYPLSRTGAGLQGAEVYRAQGCAACHTQQVRAEKEGNDIERKWGSRKTVGTDFMLEQPQLGSVRLGPDLANIGVRKTTNDVAWHYQHLLAPKSLVPKSNMPPYPYLFIKHTSTNVPGGVTFSIPGDSAVYTPTADAKALVAYLVSLKTVGSVFEAPMPMSTNAPAGGASQTGEAHIHLNRFPEGGTNAPAQGTNTAAAAATTNSPSK
jgi:cytochrome c oxidase cbb3-type subunit II